VANNAQDIALGMLLDAVVVRARQQAVDERIAGEERERQRQAAEVRKRAELRAQEERERRDKVRRVLGQGGALLGCSIVVWLITPIVGSIGAAFSETIDRMVFLDGDTGDTSGSGPVALYKLLAILLLFMVASLMVIGLTLPLPRGGEVLSVPALGGGAIGLLILLFEVFTGSGSESSWWWLPVLAVVFHLAYGLIRKLNEAGPATPANR